MGVHFYVVSVVCGVAMLKDQSIPGLYCFDYCF